MIFAHDTEMALQAAAALANTAADDDALPDPAALAAFVRRWGWTGDRVGDAAELAAVRALRPRLREVWCADEAGAVELVNAMLREARALPQLVRHDEWDYHLHATPPDAPLDVRMLVEAAMALVDVMRMGELGRLRVCAGEGCDALLVDLSKNRSRRFCGAACGNRAAVAAYRARRAAGPAG